MDATKECLAVDVPTACQMLGIGRTMLYQLGDEIPSYTVGRKRLYPVDGLRAYVARRLAEAAKQKEAA